MGERDSGSGSMSDIFGGNTNPFYNNRPDDILAYDPMFGPIRRRDVDNPYTQPGTATPVVEPTNPWWQGVNPNTGQNPNDYYGSPSFGQPAPATKSAAQIQAEGLLAGERNRQAALASNILRQFGLEQLIPEVEGAIRGGKSWEEFELSLYDPATSAGKVVDQLYGTVLRGRRENNLAPMSIAQIRSYRDSVRQLFRTSGLPTGFYDQPEDADQFLVNDLSLAELDQRVQDGYLAIAQAPPETLAKLRSYEGVGLDDGSLAAYFLDKDKAVPAIQRQVARAKLGGTAAQYGQDISRAGAERYLNAGLTTDKARDVFASAREQLPTLNTLLTRFNDPDDELTAEEYADAVVLRDPDQLLTIGRLLARNQAQFSSGAFTATDRSGRQAGLLAR